MHNYEGITKLTIKIKCEQIRFIISIYIVTMFIYLFVPHY